MTFRYRSTQYEIVVENPDGVNRGAVILELDGEELDDRSGIPLEDDQLTHQVRLVLGAAAAAPVIAAP